MGWPVTEGSTHGGENAIRTRMDLPFTASEDGTETGARDTVHLDMAAGAHALGGHAAMSWPVTEGSSHGGSPVDLSLYELQRENAIGWPPHDRVSSLLPGRGAFNPANAGHMLLRAPQLGEACFGGQMMSLSATSRNRNGKDPQTHQDESARREDSGQDESANRADSGPRAPTGAARETFYPLGVLPAAHEHPTA